MWTCIGYPDFGSHIDFERPKLVDALSTRMEPSSSWRCYDITVNSKWWFYLLDSNRNCWNFVPNAAFYGVTTGFRFHWFILRYSYEYANSFKRSYFFFYSFVLRRLKQVVTLSTYSFVIACIFGRQCIDNGSKDISIDAYFPLWTVLQILFYMGLLKVRAELFNDENVIENYKYYVIDGRH